MIFGIILGFAGGVSVGVLVMAWLLAFGGIETKIEVRRIGPDTP